MLLSRGEKQPLRLRFYRSILVVWLRKINPLLRTRPQQNTGIHDECEVRYRCLFVNSELRVPSAAQWLTDSAVAGEKQPLRNFSWFAYRCLRKYIHFRSLAHKRGWDTMNYTVYCRLAWPKKCFISVMCDFDNARWHPANAGATPSCPRSCDLV